MNMQGILCLNWYQMNDYYSKTGVPTHNHQDTHAQYLLKDGPTLASFSFILVVSRNRTQIVGVEGADH